MAIQLGSAYGKVSLDASGVKKGVDSAKSSLGTLEKSAKSVGASLQDIGRKMTVGLTLPIAALGVQSIKLASDLVETKAKVKVVFGDMTDYVMKWSENSSKSMQLSRQEALEAAGTFGNLFVAMKIGKEDAAKMSTTLVQLAADLGSINDIDPSLVLIKLKSGIVGETEAVRDLGIDLRATVVEAKAAEMGFQKLNGQFSQGDLIAARYAIILEQTKVAQGDIARTGGELAGQLRQMNAQWKDTLATLGQNLLPIALKVVTWLNQMLEKFNALSPAQQKIIGGIILLVAVIGPLLVVFGALLPMIKSTHSSFNLFSGGIIGLISGFVKLVAAAAVVVTVLQYFGVATGAVGAGILGLNTAIVGLAGTVASVVLPVLAVIAVVGLLYYAWKKNLFGIQDLVHRSVAGYKQAWGRFTEWWKSNTKDAGEEVHQSMIRSSAGIAESFARMGQQIRSGWQNFTSWLSKSVAGIATWISKAFQNIPWATVGKNILLGLANGMLLGIPNLLAMAKKVAEALLAQIKKSLGIKSPSTEAMKLGAFTSQGFMIGMQNAMDPDKMARALARPITNNTSSRQQNINMNFANGVSLHQVKSMLAENNEALMNTMVSALGGA